MLRKFEKKIKKNGWTLHGLDYVEKNHTSGVSMFVLLKCTFVQYHLGWILSTAKKTIKLGEWGIFSEHPAKKLALLIYLYPMMQSHFNLK